MRNFFPVAAPCRPDGDFPTCPKPNPQEKPALNEAVRLAVEVQAHLVIATDPVADRLGVGVRLSDPERGLYGGDDAVKDGYLLLTGNQQLVLAGHSGAVLSTAFSPDGQRIATGSWDYTARVWDATTGKPLLIITNHSHEVWAVSFSRDGQRILTASRDGTAKIWDISTGQRLLTNCVHGQWITSAGFSPDGKRIVTSAADGTVKVWNAASGRTEVALERHRSTDIARK